jgi:hypothetical protein
LTDIDLSHNDGCECEAHGFLFEAEISSDLNDFVNLSIEIAHGHPQIVSAIDDDLDIHGLRKKAERQADRRFFAQQDPCFEALAESLPPETCSLELKEGRPRMPAIVVFILLMLRGWLGGPKSTRFQLILKESITLHRFFEGHGIKVPGASTVADNVNAVRQSTLDRVLRCELKLAASTGLDSFEDSLIDSTGVNANSKYPTDSGLMAALAMRMTGLFERLKRLKLGFPNWTQRVAAVRSREIAQEIELHAKRIGMLSGTRNVKTERKALYARIYTRVGRLVRTLTPFLSAVSKSVSKVPLPPSKRKVVQGLITQCQEDVESIAQISAYSRKRIFRDQGASAADKVYSISDEDAAIIRKGGREDLLGYRPQLAFSGRGLLTAHCLPMGNAADSGQLTDILEANEHNTGVVPKRITLDDGYTNRQVRSDYLARHEGKIEVFSFSGAKGRKVIGQEIYESEDYRKARADRSAAESRIFTLKFNHGYEDVMRRGAEGVRHEQLTKCLAYNIRRLVWLRREKAKAEREASLKKAA